MVPEFVIRMGQEGRTELTPDQLAELKQLSSQYLICKPVLLAVVYMHGERFKRHLGVINGAGDRQRVDPYVVIANSTLLCMQPDFP